MFTPPGDSPSFLPAHAKLWIASIDEPRNHELELCAQYNPKELQIDKQISWMDHKGRDNRAGRKRQDSSKQADLEFKGVEKRTIQLELWFDGYEKGESVEPDVAKLERLSTVKKFVFPDETVVRPHHCLVAWGSQGDGMRPFPCVIESLSKKYTMWDTNGRPLRVVCTVKLKEAERMRRNPPSLEPYEVKLRPR